MNTFKVLPISTLFLFCLGCQHAGRHWRTHTLESAPLHKTLTLTHEKSARQQVYLRKYDRFRGRVLDGLGLSPTATWEEIRVKVAYRLHLPEQVSWEVIAENPLIKNEFIERKREECAAVFLLPKTATWFEIRAAIERVRAEK